MKLLCSEIACQKRFLALLFLQITARHQDCLFFTVFLTVKTSTQNILKTLLQIPLKLYVHRGSYWRKKLPWTILEEQFPVPRNTSVSKIRNSVISLLWQLQCHCNPDHNKVSSLSNTTVVAVFPKLCLWRRSLCSNLGGIDPEKLYRATLNRDSGKKKPNIFWSYFSVKETLVLSFRYTIFSKGGVLDVKMTFYYCRKISIFSRGPEAMIPVKNSKYLSSFLFCRRDRGFVVWWCCFLKREAF